MSKYSSLWEYLKKDGRQTIKLTFPEIQNIIRIDIDHSFLTYKKELSQYGYKVEKISLKEKNIKFTKIK